VLRRPGGVGAVATARLPARPGHRRHRRGQPAGHRGRAGGHGITAWGATSAECEARSLEIIRTAAEFIEANAKPDPFGPVIAGYEPLPETGRRARAAELAPLIRGL